MRSKLRRFSFLNQRGQIILFVMLSILFLLTVGGGLTADIARLISQKQEMQSSLDAAALAGAGKLGFDDTVFPTARDFAVDFANRNPTRGGAMTLDRNDANNVAAFDAASPPYGDVLLGIWDPTKPDGIGAGFRFEPSLDGTVVNAVMCRAKKQIPASFLSLWGLVQLNVATAAVATSNPPLNPPPDTCVFPIGVSDCPFRGNTSLGCGTVITLSTSSGGVPMTTSGGNTAAWLSLNSSPPSAENVSQQIADAVNGECNNPTTPSLDTNGGVMQSAYTALYNLYPAKYNASDTLTVMKPNPSGGDPIVAYEGQGWAVAVPVLSTGSCNADGSVSGNINETYPIVGWTRMVITQVIDRGNCAVTNTADANSAGLCEALRAGTPIPGLNNPSQLRAVFGYYECVINPSPPRPNPGPRSALATKLRLVR